MKITLILWGLLIIAALRANYLFHKRLPKEDINHSNNETIPNH